MADIPVIERIRGERIATAATRPFLMDDPERVYIVEQGYLDVFAVELRGDEPVNRRRFVARVPADSMAFGNDRVPDATRPDSVFGFLAVPSLDAVLIEGERAGVAADTFDLAATAWIDDWIARLSEFPVRGCPVPLDAELLEADPDVGYPAGAVLSAQHGDIVWVLANARMRWLGRSDMVVDKGEPLLPLTERTWFEIDVDTEVTAVYTPTALLTERLWPALLRFGTRILEHAILAEAQGEAEIETRRRRAHGARRASLTRALGGLGEVLGASHGPEHASLEERTSLQAAVQLVARSCGVSAEIRERAAEQEIPADASEATAVAERLVRRAGMRTRRLELAPGWWKRDGPSFLGFSEADGRPIAVLSIRRGGYRVVDPEAGTECPVNRRRAAGIAPEGLAFYPALPDELDGAGNTLRFALHRRGQDLRTVLAVGALGGTAALLVPILTGQVLAEFIPRANVPAWGAALAALTLLALGNAVFLVVRGLALLRIEGRIDERLQAAIWSRLIALPAPFFRRFTAGDLAARANAIGDVRRMLTGTAVHAAISGLFSMFSLALLFFYHWLLALYVCAMLSVMAAATWAFSYGQVRHYRDVFRMQGEIDGFVFQMINGVAKLRVANAESHALAHWARRFSEQKRASLRARRWAAGQHALTGLFQPLALAVIYGVVYYAGPTGGTQPRMDLADFLSFNAAFGQLTAAVGNLTISMASALGVVPLLERIEPVLEARPELARAGIAPGDLQGDIEFSNVTFRYAARTPNAVEDVSFRIRPGEYVAFVGPSGGGKSTIYRLLLGFEQPTSGSVFLDGNDLSGLDLVAVRQRMGVVLQHGRLVAGSIYENIAGTSPLSADETWSAARAAALEDDIRAMPMQMRTVVPADGAGLSVGQKQRLLIARAFARRPRVLLFDEATSALDNRAQAVVQATLKKLGATRVVIAHRLSSIRDVDRIYVLDGGRIVESGAYDDLIAGGGLFASLARRQLFQTQGDALNAKGRHGSAPDTLTRGTP